MLLLALLTACGPSGDTFGLSRAGEPADVLYYNNGPEPEYLDPGLATGHPDGNIIKELFDGLTEYDPEDLSPRPSHAVSWDAHPDGRGYTFHLRDDATWSDGTPVTVHDYLWTWERVLNPVFLSRYAQQLYAVQNAGLYNTGRIHVVQRGSDLPAGTPVVLDRSMAIRLGAATDVLREPGGSAMQALPSGAVVAWDAERDGWLRVTFRPGCPSLGDLTALLECKGEAITGWIPADSGAAAWPILNERVVTGPAPLVDDEGRGVDTLARGEVVVVRRRDGGRARVYLSARERFGWVDEALLADPRGDQLWFEAHVADPIDWPGEGDSAAPVDSADPTVPEPSEPAGIEVRADQLFTSPEVLGMRAIDDWTLDVRFEGVAPYFLQQTSHTTLRAVPWWCIEAHGSAWTRPDNIVTSGPFTLALHEVRDRFELERNEGWWGVETVALRKVVAYSIDSQVTATNLYRAGYTDLMVASDVAPDFVPMFKTKSDFHVSPALSVYLYRLNTDAPPLDDPRVRKALAMAIDKRDIVAVLKAGEIPADHLVPPLPDYDPAIGPQYDPQAARELLAEAGYPDGAGFPEISILYNTLERHKHIAGVVQDHWRRELNIGVQVQNREWKTYLKAVNSQDYTVARGGWIGDYLDPNTFLDLWLEDGGNNNTGWGTAEYDALLLQAAQEADPEQRMATLARAEAILNEQMPFIPLYWYVWPQLWQADVHGYHPNLIDQHPLRYVWLDR